MSRRVLLIRHGQTDWNVEGRWQGMMDVPLNETGLSQARVLGDHLKQRPLRTIYSSDLQRAAVTAQLIGERLAIAPQYDQRLRELNIGRFQGLTYPEIAEQHPNAAGEMRDNYLGFVFPDGESRQMLQERAHEFWQSVIQDEAGPEVAIVTHGGWIRMLLLKLFPEHQGAGSHGLSNTSVTLLEEEGAGWKLAQIGSTEHLTEEGAINKDSL